LSEVHPYWGSHGSGPRILVEYKQPLKAVYPLVSFAPACTPRVSPRNLWDLPVSASCGPLGKRSIPRAH